MDLLKTDVRNTFNSIKRSHLLDQVYQDFPDLLRHVALIYSSSSPLGFLKGDTRTILSSKEGPSWASPFFHWNSPTVDEITGQSFQHKAVGIP